MTHSINSKYLNQSYHKPPQHQKNRSRKYVLIEQILSAVTHGIGVALGIVGLVLLIIKAINDGGSKLPLRTTCFAIYGAILILFYLASTLYHSLYFTRAKKIFQIFDHSAIYLLIAGTYLPYCLITLGAPLGWTLISFIWILVILGIIYKSIWIGKYKIISTLLYVGMGWLCVFATKPLWDKLGSNGFWLLFWGGVAFTVGAVIYSFKNIYLGHVIWHLFVMLGTILMFFSIYFYV